MSTPDPRHPGTRLPPGAHRECRRNVNLRAGTDDRYAHLAARLRTRQGTLMTNVLEALAEHPELLKEIAERPSEVARRLAAHVAQLASEIA